MLKTGINLRDYGYGTTDLETLAVFKQAGFDTFFTEWNEHDAKYHVNIANEAAKLGFQYESIHACFNGINCIWEQGEAGEAYLARLKRCVDDAANSGVLYITVHVMNVPKYNYENPSLWSELGVNRFAELVGYAEKKGIKVAFENVEFPQYQLKKLIGILRNTAPNALRFCWDVGHEHCYPAIPDRVSELYGDLIIGTHMHDNFGQVNSEVITWEDDVHVMPFDGTLNYKKVGDSLKKIGYQGTITLELVRSERQWNILPWYKDYTFEEFAAEAHKKAERIALLCV